VAREISFMDLMFFLERHLEVQHLVQGSKGHKRSQPPRLTPVEHHFQSQSGRCLSSNHKTSTSGKGGFSLAPETLFWRKMCPDVFVFFAAVYRRSLGQTRLERSV